MCHTKAIFVDFVQYYMTVAGMHYSTVGFLWHAYILWCGMDTQAYRISYGTSVSGVNFDRRVPVREGCIRW